MLADLRVCGDREDRTDLISAADRERLERLFGTGTLRGRGLAGRGSCCWPEMG